MARLYDLDVRSKDKVWTRSDLGAPARLCFLCEQDAKSCARSRRHSVEDMLAWIEQLLSRL